MCHGIKGVLKAQCPQDGYERTQSYARLTLLKRSEGISINASLGGQVRHRQTASHPGEPNSPPKFENMSRRFERKGIRVAHYFRH